MSDLVPLYAIMIAIILGTLGLFVFLSMYMARRERQRAEALQQVALQMGLQYRAGEPDAPSAWRSFNLFTHGHSRKVVHQLLGTTRHTPIQIFEYRYTTGSGKHRHTHHFAGIFFELQDVSLPAFHLRPEGLGDAIKSLFIGQDINFENRPQFSSKYQLRGQDETAVRTLFSERVLQAIEADSKEINLEANGNLLLFYRPRQTLDPETLQAFLEDGYRIYSLFYTRTW